MKLVAVDIRLEFKHLRILANYQMKHPKLYIKLNFESSATPSKSICPSFNEVVPQGGSLRWFLQVVP